MNGSITKLIALFTVQVPEQILRIIIRQNLSHFVLILFLILVIHSILAEGN